MERISLKHFEDAAEKIDDALLFGSWPADVEARLTKILDSLQRLIKDVEETDCEPFFPGDELPSLEDHPEEQMRRSEAQLKPPKSR